jgi:hypothetical protein
MFKIFLSKTEENKLIVSDRLYKQQEKDKGNGHLI